jgi:hypothetical protein
MKTFDELFVVYPTATEVFEVVSAGNLSLEHFLEWYRMNDTKAYSQGYGDGFENGFNTTRV